METTNLQQTVPTISKGALWAGRIISGLCILFLLVDAIMKVIETTISVEASVALGWPASLVQMVGIILLLCTIVYTIPRTATLGALLVTIFLGGATAIMVRAGQPFFFPIVLGVLVWVGLLLRDPKLRRVFI